MTGGQKVGFETRVIVSPSPDNSRQWVLVEPLEYQADHDHFMVPKGFVTDFASVPRVVAWLIPRYGRWTPAAILHDYLWSEARAGRFNKPDADGIFNQALRELGVPFLRRWLMWTAVRWAGGPKTWLAKGPSQFARMIATALPGLVFVVVPAVVVFVFLLLGMILEYLVYLPLRYLHRDTSKSVNTPELSDLATT